MHPRDTGPPGTVFAIHSPAFFCDRYKHPTISTISTSLAALGPPEASNPQKACPPGAGSRRSPASPIGAKIMTYGTLFEECPGLLIEADDAGKKFSILVGDPLHHVARLTGFDDAAAALAFCERIAP